MIQNKSIPLRVPPHWINADNDEELQKRIALRKKTSGLVNGKSKRSSFDPKNFVDADALHGALSNTTWSIEYLDFLIKKGDYQLISAAAGRINSILLVIDIPPDEIQALTHAYTTLIAALGPNRIYHILCPADANDRIKGWFSALNLQDVEVNYYSTVFNVSCWAQDPFVALYSQKHDRTILAVSNDFNRFDDQTIACDVGAQSKTIFDFPSYYYLQGGNILNTLDHALIGKDYIHKNTGRAFLGDEEDILASFSGLFNGKNCLSVGLPEAIPAVDRTPVDPGNGVKAITYSGTWQPVFHIDMFITPTGIRSSANGDKEILLVGSLTEAKKALSGFSSSAEMTRFSQYCDTYAKYFDGIVQQLDKYFTVVTIPVYPGKASFTYAKVKYEPNYYLVYNNVVIENYKDENGVSMKNVYMPIYAVTSKDSPLNADPIIDKELKSIRICLDDYATKVWESVGFKVCPISGMDTFAQSGGSIHCMTKILKRNNITI